MLFIAGGALMKTLSEVVKLVGMSRRVIQEYEKAGLSKTPSETNKYGHLLYDDKTIEHLRKIRFYRDMGYDKKQIRAFFEDKELDRRKELSSRIEQLEQEKKRLEVLIGTAKEMAAEGISPSVLYTSYPMSDELPYDTISAMLQISYFADMSESVYNENFFNAFTEKDGENMIETAERLVQCFEQGMSCESDEVQGYVKEFHSIASKALSGSVFLFSLLVCVPLAPDTETAKEFDEAFGQGSAEYICSAVRYYCKNGFDNPTDNAVMGAIKALWGCERRNSDVDAPEVTAEVEKIYNVIRTMNIILPDKHLNALYRFGRAMGSKELWEQLDSSAKRKYEYVSRAICSYCEKLL